MVNISELVEAVFDHYDLDHSGHLSMKQARNFVTDLYKMMGEELSSQEKNKIVKSLDVEKNGIVSKEEMAIVLKAALSKKK